MAQRVRFERPPVIEVVCGVLFGTLPRLRTAHVGVFWNLLRDDFPTADEAPPLLPVIETQETSLLDGSDLALEAPLPRSWFRTTDGHGLIQLQRDRFVYNWKRESPEDGAYPSYDAVIIEFEERWAQFGDFVAREGLGELVPRQFELIYVNIIPKEGIPTNDPVLIDHALDTSHSRFLPEPESFNWQTSYPLPDENGRLHMVANSVRQSTTGKPGIRLDMTARGINDEPTARMREWFDLAHTWIVNGFADVTTESMQQKVWGRQE
jgi:uncharacterized protein (TIGR04255 family)